MPALTAFMMNHPGSMPDLKSLRWHKRVLLIFSGASDRDKEAEQRDILDRAQKGLAERDLQVFFIKTDTEKARHFRRSVLPQEDGRNSGFTVVLIGKDGGVKLTRDHVLPVPELFGTIDAMPMRQDERNKR